MSKKRARRSFSKEFKQDAVNLVTHQGYSFQTAAEAVGVEARLLRDWHEKLAPIPEPCGDDVIDKALSRLTQSGESRIAKGENWTDGD